MHVGLMIYGSIETLTGGYLYDRKFLEFLASQGDRVDVISLARRTRLSLALAGNARPSLLRRVARAPFDVLVQDELIHPSTVLINPRLRSLAACPIVTIVHLLRSSERAVRLLHLVRGPLEISRGRCKCARSWWVHNQSLTSLSCAEGRD